MSTDHPDIPRGAGISCTSVARFPYRDPTSVIGEFPVTPEADVPDLDTIMGNLVLDLELDAPGNNEYFNGEEVAILPTAISGDLGFTYQVLF